MKLISCDGCAHVFDLDKVPEPELYDDDGCVIRKNSRWNGDTYIRVFTCPHCGEAIDYD
jgi:hypothetical protein